MEKSLKTAYIALCGKVKIINFGIGKKKKKRRRRWVSKLST